MAVEMFVPDPSLEVQRFEVISGATADLLGRHLADKQHDGSIIERMPIDWRSIATSTLGLERDTPMPKLMAELRASYDGWLPFLQERFDLSSKEINSMRKARAASFLVGTLTEDNLSGYVRTIYATLMTAPPDLKALMMHSLGVWTREEDGHGRAMNAYGELTDLLLPEAYTRERASQLYHGSSEEVNGITHFKVYTSLQEPMANIAHRKDAALHDPVGFDILMAIAADEARHGKMFRGEAKHLRERFADDLISTLRWVIENFGMPGQYGIKNYRILAAVIHSANLLTEYDLFDTVHTASNQWGIKTLEPIGDKAKEDQEAIVYYLDTHKSNKPSLVEDESIESPHVEPDDSQIKAGRFVLGHTLTVTQLRTAREEYAEKMGMPKKSALAA